MSKKRSLAIEKGGPRFDMKHFITRTTILRVYREALQIGFKMKDPSMKLSTIEMMKDEFRPFKIARDDNVLLT